MKAVAFNGSPRRRGNTEFLLRKVLEPIAEAGIDTELVQIGGRPLRGCTACNTSSWGRPRTSGMTAEMTALIDRAGYVAVVNGGLFARKIGAAVVAQRRGGAVNVPDSINLRPAQHARPGRDHRVAHPAPRGLVAPPTCRVAVPTGAT